MSLEETAGNRRFSADEICAVVGGTLVGDGKAEVRGVAGLDEAGAGDLSFLASEKYRPALQTTRATVVLVDESTPAHQRLTLIQTADPYAALAQVLHLFDPGPPIVAPGVHPTAVVDAAAQLAEGVAIGAHAVVEARAELDKGATVGANSFVGAGARLGASCYLFPGVFIGQGCVLGARVRVHPGAVIGADGFGYAPVDGRYHKIPQIGIVEIEDDVEIGANVCIDRATLGKTCIGSGTKIDNLVQVGHNVAIGADTVIVSQAGIAGSTKVGRRSRLGGQAGIGGHLSLGEGVSVAAQAGVIGDLEDGAFVSGYPAQPHGAAMRSIAALRRLPDLLKRVRTLESGLGRRDGKSTRKERRDP